MASNRQYSSIATGGASARTQYALWLPPDKPAESDSDREQLRRRQQQQQQQLQQQQAGHPYAPGHVRQSSSSRGPQYPSADTGYRGAQSSSTAYHAATFPGKENYGQHLNINAQRSSTHPTAQGRSYADTSEAKAAMPPAGRRSHESRYGAYAPPTSTDDARYHSKTLQNATQPYPTGIGSKYATKYNVPHNMAPPQREQDERARRQRDREERDKEKGREERERRAKEERARQEYAARYKSDHEYPAKSAKTDRNMLSARREHYDPRAQDYDSSDSARRVHPSTTPQPRRPRAPHEETAPSGYAHAPGQPQSSATVPGSHPAYYPAGYVRRSTTAPPGATHRSRTPQPPQPIVPMVPSTSSQSTSETLTNPPPPVGVPLQRRVSPLPPPKIAATPSADEERRGLKDRVLGVFGRDKDRERRREREVERQREKEREERDRQKVREQERLQREREKDKERQERHRRKEEERERERERQQERERQERERLPSATPRPNTRHKAHSQSLPVNNAPPMATSDSERPHRETRHQRMASQSNAIPSNVAPAQSAPGETRQDQSRYDSRNRVLEPEPVGVVSRAASQNDSIAPNTNIAAQSSQPPRVDPPVSASASASAVPKGYERTRTDRSSGYPHQQASSNVPPYMATGFSSSTAPPNASNARMSMLMTNAHLAPIHAAQGPPDPSPSTPRPGQTTSSAGHGDIPPVAQPPPSVSQAPASLPTPPRVEPSQDAVSYQPMGDPRGQLNAPSSSQSYASSTAANTMHASTSVGRDHDVPAQSSVLQQPVMVPRTTSVVSQSDQQHQQQMYHQRLQEQQASIPPQLPPKEYSPQAPSMRGLPTPGQVAKAASSTAGGHAGKVSPKSMSGPQITPANSNSTANSMSANGNHTYQSQSEAASRANTAGPSASSVGVMQPPSGYNAPSANSIGVGSSNAARLQVPSYAYPGFAAPGSVSRAASNNSQVSDDPTVVPRNPSQNSAIHIPSYAASNANANANFNTPQGSSYPQTQAQQTPSHNFNVNKHAPTQAAAHNVQFVSPDGPSPAISSAVYNPTAMSSAPAPAQSHLHNTAHASSTATAYPQASSYNVSHQSSSHVPSVSHVPSASHAPSNVMPQPSQPSPPKLSVPTPSAPSVTYRQLSSSRAQEMPQSRNAAPPLNATGYNTSQPPVSAPPTTPHEPKASAPLDQNDQYPANSNAHPPSSATHQGPPRDIPVPPAPLPPGYNSLKPQPVDYPSHRAHANSTPTPTAAARGAPAARTPSEPASAPPMAGRYSNNVGGMDTPTMSAAPPVSAPGRVYSQSGAATAASTVTGNRPPLAQPKPMPATSTNNTSMSTRVPIVGIPGTPTPNRFPLRETESPPPLTPSSSSSQEDILLTPPTMPQNVKSAQGQAISVSFNTRIEEKAKKGFFNNIFNRTSGKPPAQFRAPNGYKPPTPGPSGGQRDSFYRSKAPSAPSSRTEFGLVPNKITKPPPIEIPSSSGRFSPDGGLYAVNMRLVSSRRHRTVSAASLEAQDGTANNTVIGSPTSSMVTTSRMAPSPPLRDPFEATQDWRDNEEQILLDSGTHRRRRPGVSFDLPRSDRAYRLDYRV